ncbi:MAG: Holliday junction branch migration protein RuvA [Rhodoluna sp.]
MIASLRGILSAKTSGQLVVDVNGVGYLVHVTSNSAAKFLIGDEVNLFTAMIVREDAMTLFGFTSALEQELFDQLRSVTGVGPKSALAILGALSAAEIASAVALDNDAAFKAVSGIGPKTAKLITVTLAGKLSHLVLETQGQKPSADYGSVVEALVSLGWAERSAQDAVREASAKVKLGEGRDVVLRLALASLGGAKTSGGK